MKSIFSFFLLVVLVCYGFQCDDEPSPAFDFQIPISVTPEKKEYKAGDTLTLKIAIENDLIFDKRSKQFVEAKNASVPIALYVGERYFGHNTPGFSPSLFDFITSLPDSLVRIEHMPKSSEIKFGLGCETLASEAEISIILKTSGIFKLETEQFRQVEFGHNFNCLDFHSEGELATLSFIFNVNDPNLDILKMSPLPHNVFISGEDAEKKTKRKELFWFKVNP